MKKLLIIAAIVFQLAALAWMALSREYVLQTGQLVKFQTAPIDPRDLFRGDYVRLRYSMSELPVSQLDKALQNTEIKKGDLLYVWLTVSPAGLAKVKTVQPHVPQDGSAFIKARVTNNRPAGSKQSLHLKYGIEQYFVEQGKGLAIEQRQGRRNAMQLPMIMHVALSEDGTAVLKDHQWSRVGIGLVVENQPERDALPEEASATFKLTLKNMSDTEIKLPFRPGNCSFSLISIVSAPEVINKKPAGCEHKIAETKSLMPQQSLTFLFDFNDPQWLVDYKNQPTPMGKLPWSYRFRLIYDEIDETAVAAGEIVSRALHGRGQVD